MEIWKNIKGFEGLYKVSNKGRVKSVKRVVNHGSIVKERKKAGGYLWEAK